jgi:hypothetical protein
VRWWARVPGWSLGVWLMLVAAPVLTLPWYAGPRYSRPSPWAARPVADILRFDLLSFVTGVLVLLLLAALLGSLFAFILRRGGMRAVAAGVAYGLLVWALLRRMVLPAMFPLVSDKGFPPAWYAIPWSIYGLVLGIGLMLLARGRSRRRGVEGADTPARTAADLPSR